MSVRGHDGAPVSTRGRPRAPLADDVRDRIADELILSGEVPVGDLLPPEGRLATRYGVSHVTVRASLRSLQEAGMVRIRNGVGATVLPISGTVTHGFDRLVSLETFGREAGHVIANAQVAWSEEPADPVTAQRLGRAVRTPMVRAERVKTVDGMAVAWFVDRVPGDVLDAATLRAEYRGSILDILLIHRELGVAYEDADLLPVALNREVADRLEVPVGTVALYVDALTFSFEGRALEWAQSWLLPGHFHLCVRRRPQAGGSRTGQLR